VIPQLKYFQSEVFELTEAILNRDINWNYDTEIQDIKPLDEHIAEEIADVQVMLNQFREYYGITDEEVKDIMIEKIDRQIERIENELNKK
jgi:NTP pyrophosphatase (non-canonical NTP hydrolase)